MPTPTHRLLTANVGLMATCPALTLPLFTALILIGETPGITGREITKRIYDRSVSRGLFRFVKREGGRFVRVEGEFMEKAFRLCRLSLTEEGRRMIEEYLGDVFGEPVALPTPNTTPETEITLTAEQQKEKADQDFQEWVNVLMSNKEFWQQAEEARREETRLNIERRQKRAIARAAEELRQHPSGREKVERGRTWKQRTNG